MNNPPQSTTKTLQFTLEQWQNAFFVLMIYHSIFNTHYITISAASQQFPHKLYLFVLLTQQYYYDRMLVKLLLLRKGSIAYE